MARYRDIKGSTGCLFLKGNCIPVYRLSHREWILMDSGSRFDREELFSYLEEQEIRVTAVLTSHAHYDHMGNHARLQERFGCECIMTAFDAGAVRDTVSLKSCFYSCTETEIRTYFADMVCRADRLIEDGAVQTEVSGIRFGVFGLPGHAASQVGFTTPDGVSYLGDCLLGPEEAGYEKFVYMLDWKAALATMEQAEAFDGSVCILSHYGVYRDIKAISRANRQAFEKALAAVRGLAEPEFFLEDMVKKTVTGMGIAVKSIRKARLMERMVRSMLEYMVETGELDIGVKDGMIVYTRP